jgi:protein phosphatase 2C family protein 2/3
MVTAYPDVVVKPLHKDVEFIILACDGIWDCKTSAEVVRYYKEVLPMHGTSNKDIHNCNHKLLDEICPDTFDEMR